jgi:hypothetical protein
MARILLGLHQIESGDVLYETLEDRLLAIIEDVQDSVGGMLTDTNSIDFTYTDGDGTIKADLKLDGDSLAVGAGGTKVSKVDADSVTVSNLETDNFKADVIDTDGTLNANSDTRLATQKAVKTYVDGVANGIKWKASVRAATTANIVGTYDAGVFTVTADGALELDGVTTLVNGDRILVKNQTTASENGIYTLTTQGSTGVSAVLTRTADADASIELVGSAVLVEEGTVNADQGYTMITNAPVTVGSTSLVYTQFTGLGQVIAGDGLTKTGNQIDVNPGEAIEITSDAVTVKLDGSSLAKGSSGLKVSAIDADSVTVSNLETDNFKTGTIVTTINDTSDTSLPTEGAVKEYVDLAVSLTGSTSSDISIANPGLLVYKNYTVLAGDLSVGNPTVLTIPNGVTYEYGKDNILVFINGQLAVKGYTYTEVSPTSGDATQISFVDKALKAGNVVTYVITSQPKLAYEVAYTYDGSGRISTATFTGDVDKVVTYTYKTSGAALGKMDTITIVEDGVTSTKTYSYDVNGVLTGIASVLS